MDKLLIIFIKNPELGKAKTRLAKKIGPEAALAVYLKLLGHTHEVAEALSCDKAVYYASYIDTEDQWDNRRYKKHVQKGGDLGVRMRNAVAESFDAGYSSVCIIGADIYELTPGVVKDAFRRLETHDMVLGPAKDGGYYLIGMNAPYLKIFDLERWGTPDVFSESIKIIEQERLTYGLTKLLNDIDVLEDLKGTDLMDILDSAQRRKE